jgi:ABC-type lipoprotein release transport system permease subunit
VLEEGGAVLGKSLAEDLGVFAGDWIYITYRTEQA